MESTTTEDNSLVGAQFDINEFEQRKNHDLFFSLLNAKVEELAGPDAGYLVICGPESDDMEEEEELVEKYVTSGPFNESLAGGLPPVYTKDQLDKLRVVILTARRDDALDKAEDMVTCGHRGDDSVILNCQNGNKAIRGIEKFIAACNKKTTEAEKLDLLFGLTRALTNYDYWLTNNELSGKGGLLDCSLQSLAKEWSNLLSKPDTVLGIDSEYTRPGIEAMLSEFQDLVEKTNLNEPYEFRWKKPDKDITADIKKEVPPPSSPSTSSLCDSSTTSTTTTKKRKASSGRDDES